METVKLYNLAEVEKAARVTRRTLYSWIDCGYLQAVKIGGRWKVPQDVMSRLLAGELEPYGRRENRGSITSEISSGAQPQCPIILNSGH